MLSKRKSKETPSKSVYINLRGKKGVSVIVSYVLLIVIAFSISALVYTWLKGYVSPGVQKECSEDVSLSIVSYNYSCGDNEINFTLKNNGLFNIDGFILRVDNRSESAVVGGDLGFGRYTLNNTGLPFNASETKSYTEDVSSIGGDITFIGVQPYIVEERIGIVYCDSISKREVNCSS